MIFHTPTEEEIAELSRLLISPYLNKQAEVKRLLDRMGPRGIDALLLIIRTEKEKKETRWPRHRSSPWFLLLLSVIFYSLPVEQTQWLGHVSLGLFAYSLVLPFLEKFIFTSELHQKAVEQLARCADLRSMGTLIENMDVSHECVLALVRLLPRLQESDASLLNAPQRQRLYEELDKSYRWRSRYWHKEFVPVILMALEQVGDAEAIPSVKELAERTRNPVVQAAAKDCLPFLKNRGHRRQIAETLLRPSEPSAAPETLLRPAGAAVETEPQQLLRPASREDG